MIVVLLLKIVQILLIPISILFAGVDSLIAPLLVMASSITFIFSAIQFPLYLFGYLLGSKDLIIFIFTFSTVLLPIEFAISMIWWLLYKIPVFGIKDK
ncbi:MAG: hypothetical protein Q4A23_02535 [bacterium]|nr:hypothetical protein [bacterium]